MHRSIHRFHTRRRLLWIRHLLRQRLVTLAMEILMLAGLTTGTFIDSSTGTGSLESMTYFSSSNQTTYVDVYGWSTTMFTTLRFQQTYLAAANHLRPSLWRQAI